MDGQLHELLELLDAIGRGLEQLSETAQCKLQAVREDDLLALDEVMKREQALSLNFRGLEQKREKCLAGLGLESVPLSQLAQHVPAQAQEQVAQAVRELDVQYQSYRDKAGQARSELERALGEIQNTLAGLGAVARPEGPGYEPDDPPGPPRSMKTDFRA